MRTATETIRSVRGAVTARSARDLPDVVRLSYLTFVLVALLNHAWFVDLSDRSPADALEGGSLPTQLLFGSTLVVGLVIVGRLGFERLRPLAGRLTLLFGFWLLTTALLSDAPALSLRRLALYVIVAFLAASLLVVARGARQLADALAMAGFTILAASYLGLVLAPSLTIHSVYDLTGEIGHDGLWRGIYPHKNEAGMAMTLLVVVGLFVAAVRSRWLGWSMVVAAAIFLLGSGSKTPTITLAMVLAISWLCGVVRSRGARILLLTGPVAFLILITIGSIVLPPVRGVLDVVLPDATFTARNEVWSFAIDSIARHPLKGFGFGAFWLTEHTVFGSVSDPDSNWVQMATQAHNSFLDAMIAMGLPGIVITLAVFVLVPAMDFLRCSPGGPVDPSTNLFLRLWQLTLLSASLETILFNPNTPAFGMVVMAICGLRMRTVRPVVL